MDSKLQRGDWAPPFKTYDIRGEEFDFSKAADWGIWLAFYRYASCPMCNQHFDDVVGQQLKLLENRILFVAIFESETKNFPRSIAARDFPNVKIIPDPDHRLYELYGVEQSWAKLFTPQSAIARVQAGLKGYREQTIDGPLNRIPAHFLVLPQGMIHQARYGKSAADHVKWRDLDDFYDSVRGQLSQVNRPMPPIPEAKQAAESAPPPPSPETTPPIFMSPDPLDRRAQTSYVDAAATDDKTLVLDPTSELSKTLQIGREPELELEDENGRRRDE